LPSYIKRGMKLDTKGDRIIGEIVMATDRTSKPVILVTGSSGLIGTRIVQEFLRDFTVVGIDRNVPDEHTGMESITCDLTNDDDTRRAMDEIHDRFGNKIASVIHLAAYYDFSGAHSELYRTLTVEGTRRLLRELRKFRVEQFVFTSTLLVMEPAEDIDEIITENSPQKDDPWNYPRSKIEAENVIRSEHGVIPTVILRIAGVYDEQGNSIPITQHIARIYEKKLESYFFPGDPDHGQPFVHLDDLISCIRRVVQQREVLDELEVFLIAEPDIMSYNELQDQLGELIHGNEWTTIRIPKPVAKAGAWVREKMAGDEETFIKPWMVDLADDHYPVAIDRARSRLGWQPKHRLRSTLTEMVRHLIEDPKKWYEANKLPLPDELQDETTQGEPSGKESR
jgi:nucleoside-diphosphate-sugar epimerase